MNKIKKEEIAEEITNLTSGYTDEELEYAIKIMIFWQKERKRQNKEIKKIKKEVDK